MQINRRTLVGIILVTIISTSVLTLASLKFAVQTFGVQVPFLQSANVGEMGADFKKIAEALAIIEKNALEKVDRVKLIDGAIEGMIKQLDDPYSTYLNPKAAGEFHSSLQSSFQGIGAEVTLKNGKVTIVSPFKGSPAEKAGLRPEDQIITVDGKSVEGLSLTEAVSKIRGPKGSKVVLEIMRAGLNTPMSVTVVRDEIPIVTVYSSVIEQGGKKIGKIEITQFSMETAEDFKKQLAELESKGIQGLIVDVRGNPGGLLKSVIDIGNLLVPKGGTIVKIEYSDGKKEAFTSENRGEKYPIVVLADKGSASAAEILAAAMKENGSQVIGTSTFGKGTVQNTQDLSDKSQLKLTIAKWLTPDGNWIHKKGVAPTISVEQPDYFKAVALPANKTLQKEMNGTEVQNLQLILNGLGFNPGRNDGYFDAGTEKAVKDFQEKMKLEPTGKVEGKTIELLQTELLNKMKDPKNDAQLQKAIEVMADLVK